MDLSQEHEDDAIKSAKELLSEEHLRKENLEKIPEQSEFLEAEILQEIRSFEAPRAGSAKSSGVRKKKGVGAASYLFFSTAFCVWFFSMLSVYLPVTGLLGVSPYPQPQTNSFLMPIFLVSAASASLISFLIGVRKLRER